MLLKRNIVNLHPLDHSFTQTDGQTKMLPENNVVQIALRRTKKNANLLTDLMISSASQLTPAQNLP